MNKICGYSCEHNKGGVCQITNCDKKIMMTTTTEPQVLTRWQDPTIEDLKKEINKQKELLDKIKEYIKKELSQGGPRETEDLVDGDYILELLEEIE